MDPGVTMNSEEIAAWLSALGFAFAMLNFLAINYFVTTSHTFY